VRADPADPALVVASQAGLRLALIAALQYLPARQRAVLTLRDVLQWRASEAANLLGITTTAVNGLLLRARARIEQAEPAQDEIREPAEASQRAARQDHGTCAWRLRGDVPRNCVQSLRRVGWLWAPPGTANCGPPVGRSARQRGRPRVRPGRQSAGDRAGLRDPGLPPETDGERWRAVFTENGQRRFRQGATEAKLAAKLTSCAHRRTGWWPHDMTPAWPRSWLPPATLTRSASGLGRHRYCFVVVQEAAGLVLPQPGVGSVETE
jgi:hypothetical protein